VSVKVDEDLKKNLLHVDCDPQKVTPATLLEEVKKQGFEGTIVANDQ
jgi:hypothetical protein